MDTPTTGLRQQEKDLLEANDKVLLVEMVLTLREIRDLLQQQNQMEYVADTGLLP